MNTTTLAARLKGIAKNCEERDRRAPYADWSNNTYHHRRDLGALFHVQSHMALAKALKLLNVDLESSMALDYGCGTGSWLRMLIDMGARSGRAFGVDLSAGRQARPRSRSVVRSCSA